EAIEARQRWQRSRLAWQPAGTGGGEAHRATKRKEPDMQLELGTRIECADETFGKLVDVVIDPTSRRVTHLVVERDRDSWLAQLVPVELAEPAATRTGPLSFGRRSRTCGGCRRFTRSLTCGSTGSRSTIPTGTSASRKCSHCPTTRRTASSRHRSTTPFRTIASRRARSRSGARARSTRPTATGSVTSTGSWSTRTS